MAGTKEKLLNLTETENLALCELITALKTDWPSVKFKLFGSKARGIFDAESDVDLLILLPVPVTKEIRQRIIHKVFDINLSYGTNISAFTVTEEEWQNGLISMLPVHASIEEDGIPL